MTKLTCKEITRLVSRSLDYDLPWGQRLLVRFHLLYCGACARYRRQILNMRRAIRRCFGADPELSPLTTGPALPASARRRIIDALRRS